jgi:hypothetical protein
MLVAIAVVLCSFGSGFAQAADSITISLDRAKLFTELTQLRDSINHSLMLFENQAHKGNALRRAKVANSRKELIVYRDRVNLDIEETESTARNSWTKASVERMRANMVATRLEHKRLHALL